MNIEKIAGTSITSVIMFCGSAIHDDYQYLSENIIDTPQVLLKAEYGFNTDSYEIVTNDSLSNDDKIKVIHSFSSELIENIENMPIEFSKAIDENIWDLI